MQTEELYTYTLPLPQVPFPKDLLLPGAAAYKLAHCRQSGNTLIMSGHKQQKLLITVQLEVAYTLLASTFRY